MIYYFKSKMFLRQFLSIFFIILITFLIISFVLLILTKISTEKQVLAIAESYRKETSETIRRWIRGREYSIKAQAMYLSELGKEKLDSREVQDIIKKQLQWNENFHDIVVVNDKGFIINSKEGAVPDINLSDHQYFITGMQGKAAITGFFKEEKDSIHVMAISEPIFMDGNPKYILIGYITLERIKEIVESLDLDNLGHAYLVDADGMVIAGNKLIKEFDKNGRNRRRGVYKLNTLAVNEIVQRHQGTKGYENFLGQKVFGSFEWIDALEIGLVVELVNFSVMTPIADLKRAAVVLTFIVTAAGMVLAFVLGHKTYKMVNSS